ncbi:hypothetical protein [Metaclostridioides mangenotii]|uniref:Uncharacterized protein n=1 Tax=Metaclostridioides mangenotii TaxID=1540 RepID=A0ABS4EBS5_9FIRM|nr:hypothetical protein [Clostridioides mangenotii]MBP1855384.1 hypothetical protein [Clostridioides mangenotii]
MINYTIEIPLTGYVSIEVTANNEKEAINKAFESATLEEIVEWELHEYVTQGNCSRALKNEIEVFKED